MIWRASAESLRVAAASLLLSLGSLPVLADTGGSSSYDSTAGGLSGANVSNPAQAFTRMFGGESSSDSNSPSPSNRHHRRPHNPKPKPESTSASAPAASWASQPQAAPPPADPVLSTSAEPVAESTRETPSATITNTFSKAPSVSRVSDWLPSSESTPPAEEEGISTAARIDLIAEKYGRQATVDFNSRIQEAGGVIAFRAIDNQTGERETIRIDRSGDIKLKSGWPE